MPLAFIKVTCPSGVSERASVRTSGFMARPAGAESPRLAQQGTSIWSWAFPVPQTLPYSHHAPLRSLPSDTCLDGACSHLRCYSKTSTGFRLLSRILRANPFACKWFFVRTEQKICLYLVTWATWFLPMSGRRTWVPAKMVSRGRARKGTPTLAFSLEPLNPSVLCEGH